MNDQSEFTISFSDFFPPTRIVRVQVLHIFWWQFVFFTHITLLRLLSNGFKAFDSRMMQTYHFIRFDFYSPTAMCLLVERPFIGSLSS